MRCDEHSVGRYVAAHNKDIVSRTGRETGDRPADRSGARTAGGRDAAERDESGRTFPGLVDRYEKDGTMPFSAGEDSLQSIASLGRFRSGCGGYGGGGDGSDGAGVPRGAN